MGILVQREFIVQGDDRREFERQSREGVWANMLYNGAQMVAYGNWTMNGPGDVMITHSAYANFEHWTATRPWGTYATDPDRIEETKHLRALSAGRNRLVQHSNAKVIFYDDERSEPAPFYRNNGGPLAPLPATFGRQSVVAETTCAVAPDDRDNFLESCDAVWAWQVEQGARLLIVGHDPNDSPGNLVAYVAYPSISAWELSLCGLATDAPDDVQKAAAERDWSSATQKTRLLMIATDYGAPV